MLTERMRQLIDELTELPAEDQNRVAAAIQAVLRQPPVSSDDVRSEVMAAFEEVMGESTDVLDYLRDR